MLFVKAIFTIITTCYGLYLWCYLILPSKTPHLCQIPSEIKLLLASLSLRHFIGSRFGELGGH